MACLEEIGSCWQGDGRHVGRGEGKELRVGGVKQLAGLPELVGQPARLVLHGDHV